MEKKVLLFSGGFDSRLQEWLIKPDVLLYVDMKTSYSERELEELERLSPYYEDRLIIKELPLGEYERENKYLPYRNLLLGTIAMEYGQHIYFGFNAKDDAPDKDELFLRRTTTLFRHLNKNCIDDMGWENNHFSFNAPYKDKTKTEMVAMCLEAGMSADEIKHIRTCYDGDSHIGCGVCGPCYNKAVALLNNGIYEDSLFDKPLTDKRLREAIKLLKSEGYAKKHIDEIERARAILRQTKE